MGELTTGPRSLLTVLIVSAVMLSGCTTGLLYTHTVQPLDLDLNHTPFVPEGREGAIKHLDIPIYGTSYSLSALWDSNAIGDIAKRNGFETIYYADLELLNVLQIWKEYTVHVYGR